MLQARREPIARPRLHARLARDIAEVRAAQRLRYRIFAEEMGAQVPGREQGIDCDIYDAYCDHLVVVDAADDDIVGTYRLLNGAQARRAGGFYADGEFDLRALSSVRDGAVEAGRACVRADHRNGFVLSMLWAGIADYMMRRGYRYLFGCASVSLADGGSQAAAVYRALAERHWSPPRYRVVPRTPWKPDPMPPATGVLPPLLKAYSRLGAYLCGEPAWDPHFDSADLFLLLPVSHLDSRYLQRWRRRRRAARGRRPDAGIVQAGRCGPAPPRHRSRHEAWSSVGAGE